MCVCVCSEIAANKLQNLPNSDDSIVYYKGEQITDSNCRMLWFKKQMQLQLQRGS